MRIFIAVRGRPIGAVARLSAGQACLAKTTGDALVEKSELIRIQTYLRKLFRLDTITVQGRANKDDSAEVNIGDEFIGVIFRDEDEGEISYDFNMAILEIDLPESPAS